MRDSLLIGFFMAVLTLNEVVEEYTVEELVNKLKTLP